MVDYPALAIQPANVLGSFLSGIQAAEYEKNSQVTRETALEELKSKRAEAEKRKKIEQMGDAIAGKDPLAALMVYDPQMGNALAAYQKGKRAEAAEKKNDMIANAAKLAATVKQSPLEQRPQAYAQALTLAQQRGIDITGLPPQYTPEIEPMLDQIMNAGRGLESIVKQEGGFTLKDDEVRYDAQGRVIAGNVGKDGRKPNIKGEGDLRKEFDSINKDFRLVNDAYSKITASAEDNSGASDMALIFNYMKMLDPGSTVREGEYATAEQATGVPGQVINMYNKALSGAFLNDTQRADFTSTSKRIYESQAENYNQSVGKYRELATEYDFDPDRIVKPIKGLGEETKTVAGKTYVKVKGEWYEK